MAAKKPVTISMDSYTIKQLKRMEDMYRVSRSSLVQMAVSEFIERRIPELDRQGVFNFGKDQS